MDVQPPLLNLSAYINQNLDKDLPLSSLAKRIGLSPFHFHRKFGAYFGESLHQHIKRLRLERAAFALEHGSKPVRQIARESGYKTVSAFSHAFSGFAGQSPTRYRSHGTEPGLRDARVDGVSDVPAPAWIGSLPAQPFAFVRASGSGRGRQPAVGDAIDAIERLIHPLPKRPTPDQIAIRTDVMGAAASGDADRSAVDERRPMEFIAATTDLYGIAKSGSFRVDVGVDADRIAAERSGALGLQTLPAGRYARFDLRCTPDELIDRGFAALLYGLNRSRDTPSQGTCFVRFFPATDGDGTTDWRLFIPLA